MAVLDNQNSDLDFTTVIGKNCRFTYNDSIVYIWINASNLDITGGNIDATINTIAEFPEGITIKQDNGIGLCYQTVNIMNSAWTPTSNFLLLEPRLKSFCGRAIVNASNAVIVHSLVVPRKLFNIE